MCVLSGSCSASGQQQQYRDKHQKLIGQRRSNRGNKSTSLQIRSKKVCSARAILGWLNLFQWQHYKSICFATYRKGKNWSCHKDKKRTSLNQRLCPTFKWMFQSILVSYLKNAILWIYDRIITHTVTLPYITYTEMGISAFNDLWMLFLKPAEDSTRKA